MRSFLDKRVLVADDSETVRMFLFFHLLKLLPGARLMEAEDGAEALEMLKDQDVDLILTDMNMPVMDGAGLISAVRTELKRDTPIIIVTTMGEQRDRELGLSLGANGYITKPLNVLEFRKTVMECIMEKNCR